MRRTNTFNLAPTTKQNKRLHQLADACARLWNAVTYRRRQTLFAGKINWEWQDLYQKYKGMVGSATAQQIERKNSEAWRSFFALLKKKREGRLPPHIQRVKPPGYWKNPYTGERKLMILVRCDTYRLEGDVLRLSKKLHVKWRGRPRWTGWTRQGLLTITFDTRRGRWVVRQSVEVDPPHQPLSNKRAFVDLGVLNLLATHVEGEPNVRLWSGRPALADWWYLSHEISRLKSLAKITNNGESTRRIQGLYRRRRLRFRHYVNTTVRCAVRGLWRCGVSLVVAGDLTGILGNSRSGVKANTMTHNFWSHRYLVRRLCEVAEEYGMGVVLVDERGTSSTCPLCGSREIGRWGRLFRCRGCGLEGHRDGVGVVNIGLAQGAVLPAEVVNGAVARPLEAQV